MFATHTQLEPAADPSHSHAPDPRPSTPDPSPQPDLNQDALLNDFLTADIDILNICDNHAITIAQLDAWLNQPNIQRALATLERINKQRERAILGWVAPRSCHRDRLCDLGALPIALYLPGGWHGRFRA